FWRKNDRAHNTHYEPCRLKEACGMAELRLRTVCRIKNVSANHPALELLLTKPTRLFISPESLVLCLHLLVKPCQFFRLGFTCEPERHLDCVASAREVVPRGAQEFLDHGERAPVCFEQVHSNTVRVRRRSPRSCLLDPHSLPRSSSLLALPSRRQRCFAF